MKTTLNLCFVLFAGLLFVACNSVPKSSFDQETEKKKIQELLKLGNQFLISQDLSIFRKLVACDDSSINVIRGDIYYQKITNKTDDQIVKEYSFDVLKYTKIDELTDPIISFSPDLKMAYIAGRTKFYYESTDSLGNKKNGEFVDAWLTVWENHDGCWSEKAIAQTFDK